MPAGRGAMIGTYEEVSCDEWTGDKCPVPRWDNWCMAGTGSPLWPEQACGNIGTRRSIPCAVIQFWLTYTLAIPSTLE